MSRAYEEAQEQRLHAYIAGELGMSAEDLDGYPYQLDENASDDGVVYGWRILWDDEPPEGVEAHGASGSQWTNIAPEPDGPDGPDD